jgi:hypothetical protein
VWLPRAACIGDARHGNDFNLRKIGRLDLDLALAAVLTVRVVIRGRLLPRDVSAILELSVYAHTMTDDAA